FRVLVRELNALGLSIDMMEAQVDEVQEIPAEPVPADDEEVMLDDEESTQDEPSDEELIAEEAEEDVTDEAFGAEGVKELYGRRTGYPTSRTYGSYGRHTSASSGQPGNCSGFFRSREQRGKPAFQLSCQAR